MQTSNAILMQQQIVEESVTYPPSPPEAPELPEDGTAGQKASEELKTKESVLPISIKFNHLNLQVFQTKTNYFANKLQ